MNKVKITRAVTWSAIDILLRYGVGFLVMVWLMRTLEPEAFGKVAMLAIFTSMASLFIDGGLSQGLIQRQNTTHTDESSVFFLNLLMGLLVGSILCLAAPWIAGFYHEPILQDITYVMALSLFVNAFGSVHTSILTKNLNFKVMAKVGTVVSILSGGVALLSAYNGLGVWSLVLQTLSASFLSVILLWLWHPWRPKWVFSLQSIQVFWRFSGYLMLSSFLYRIYGNVFTMVIGRSYTAHEAGFFSQAQRLQKLPMDLLTSIIARVAFPVFSSSAGDKEKLVRGLSKALALTMFMSIPVAVFLLLLAEPLVLTLFGEKWLPSAPILQVLSVAAMLMPMQMLNISMLKALGRTDLNVRIVVIKFLLGIGFLWIAIPYGIIAIAAAFSLSAVINVFINSYYTKKLLDYGGWQQIKDILPYVFVGASMVLIILPLKIMLDLPVQVELIVSVIAGGGGYLLVSWFAKLEALDTLLDVTRRAH